jgi:hypothetical protein
MKRRGFLGALVAAPVAGPAMAKEAVAQMAFTTAPDFGLASGAIGAMKDAACNPRWMEPEEALRKAFKLGIVSREKLAELLATMSIGAGPISSQFLDPDLIASKSFSMTAKARMQKERNMDREIHRFLAKPKSFWEYGRELVEKGLIGEDTP